MKKKNLLKTVALLFAAAFVITGCSKGKSQTSDAKKDVVNVKDGEIPKPKDGDNKIVVGASASPHAEILEVAKENLKEKGWDLVIKSYTDYIQPNVALTSKDLDANYYQHKPFLDAYNKEHKTDLVGLDNIHYEPCGIFPGKTKKLEDLKDGAIIGVPNDTSNEARALNLLEKAGIIKLRKGAGINATKKDIEKNPKNVQIKEIEAAQIPRSIKDLDLAVINGNFAFEAKLSPKKDSLLIEDAKSIGAKVYGNFVAVRKGDEKNRKIIALMNALKKDNVKKFINDKYDGAVVPLF